MNLVVDLGNSRTKWACYENRQLIRQGVCGSVSGEFNAVLKRSWGALPAPDQIVYCAVTTQALAAQLERIALALWRLRPRRLQVYKQALGLTCNYQEPTQLGADRWAAMVGAYARVSAPLCVIDCGTAVTVDAVSGNGQHQGGLIIPGCGLMHQVLGDYTSRIGKVTKGQHSLSTVDTQGAVSTGTHLAVCAFIDRAVQAYQKSMQCKLQVLLTGGDAPELLPQLQSTPELVPDLVLCGLLEFAESDE